MADPRIAQESRKLTDKKTTLLRSAVEKRMTNKTTSAIDPVERRAPVQGFSAGIPWDMHLRAYDAYCAEFRPQQALIEGGCRGGFSVRELDHFIPGWRDELDERKRLADTITRLQAALEAADARLCELTPSYPPDGPATLVEAEECEKTRVVVMLVREALRSSVGGK